MLHWKTLTPADWVRKGGEALFLLLVLVVMIDPTNTVLHLKDVVFVALVGYNSVFFKPDFSYLPHILVVFAVVFLGMILGEMQLSNIDEEMLFGILKGFSPLVLLLWVRHYDVVRLTYFPVFTVCLLVVALYIACTLSELAEVAIFEYSRAHNKMIMMTHRSFLGLKVFGMYYKSIISFVFALFYFYYRVWNVPRRRWLYMVACGVVTFAFLVSGTRATMLLPFAALAIVAYPTIQKWQRLRYAFYPILAVFVLCLLLLVFMLATERGEASNNIKYAHLVSYAELFETHPEYLLFGQGPGAIFYSEGFHDWRSQTEWSYIDLLRYYGLFALGIVAVLLLPLFKLWPCRRHAKVFGLMGGYVAFLFIAGTNPLLVSSPGMIVVLAVYPLTHHLDAYVDAPPPEEAPERPRSVHL